MAVYNGERFIEEAITSVLEQRLSDIELIVVDDASTDRTADILSSFTDSRIHIFRNSQNMRLAYSLNRAFSHARGQYVARLDADDLCLPNRLLRQVSFLERHEGIAVLGGAARAIGAGRGSLVYPRSHEAIMAHLCFGNALNHPTVMFRRAAIPELYDENCTAAQDYELWSRLVWRVRFANLRRPLIAYRIHGEQSAFRLKQQQRRTARDARRAMAGKLLPGIGPEDWELFHKACEQDPPLSRDQLTHFHRLTSQMLRENRGLRVYSQRDLRRAVGDFAMSNLYSSFLGGAIPLSHAWRSPLLRQAGLRPARLVAISLARLAFERSRRAIFLERPRKTSAS